MTAPARPTGPAESAQPPRPDGSASYGHTDLDRLIHEPARLALVSHLAVVDEADFVYLSRATGLTAGNISSHMAKLETAGYVEITKGFVGKRPRTIYRLTESGRTAFDRYRQVVTALLPP